jgi:hypothetical protein
MRVVAVSSVLLFGLATSAMADITPVDPHGLFAAGGDATDIGAGQPITLSDPGGNNEGGGIFVFHNDTGSPLLGVNVDITLPNSFGAFFFTGTLFLPGAGSTSISSGIAPGPCDPSQPAASFCVELGFSASGGNPPAPLPIVPVDGNFVLDFDTPVVQGPPPIYGGVDELVATGNYSLAGCEAANLANCTGTTDTSNFRIGEWANGAVGFVSPILPTPEPRQYAGLLAGILALAIYSRRRRNLEVR